MKKIEKLKIEEDKDWGDDMEAAFTDKYEVYHSHIQESKLAMILERLENKLNEVIEVVNEIGVSKSTHKGSTAVTEESIYSSGGEKEIKY